MRSGKQNVAGLLDNTTVTDGILIPRLTSAQEAAIVSPSKSEMIYNTTLDLFRYYDGSSWQTLTTPPNDLQSAYNNSVGGSTPEILIDSTRGAVTIRDNSVGTMIDAQDNVGTSMTTVGVSGVRVISGSVSAPSFSFISDTDTGLYESVNKLAVTTGSANSALFDHITGTTGSYINIRGNSPGSDPVLTNLGSDTNGIGLGVSILGRNASATGTGGAVGIASGNGSGTGTGGSTTIDGGAGGTTGAGGTVVITGGAGGSTSGSGGAVTLQVAF